MLYAAPLLAVFALIESGSSERLRNLVRWLGLAIAVPATLLLTAPFILPYLAMQRQTGFEHPLADVIAHSARFEQDRDVRLPWAPSAPCAGGGGDGWRLRKRTSAPRAQVAALLVVLALAFLLSLGPLIEPRECPVRSWFAVPVCPRLSTAASCQPLWALALVTLAVLAGCGADGSRGYRGGARRASCPRRALPAEIRPARFPVDAPLASPGLAPAPAYAYRCNSPPFTATSRRSATTRCCSAAVWRLLYDLRCRCSSPHCTGGGS